MGQQALCCVERAEDKEVFFDCVEDIEGAEAKRTGIRKKAGTEQARVPAVPFLSLPVLGTGSGGEECAGTAREDGLPSPPPKIAQAPIVLRPEEEEKYLELCKRLAEEPEAKITEHYTEDNRRRILRFLVGEAWNVEGAFKRIHEHSAWWTSYGMDSFVETDELDETGPIFVCGEDRCGRPTLVARPCAHHSRSREESITMARRCVYTIWRCVLRYRPGTDKHSVIYDARGLNPRRNLDFVFVREVGDALSSHFPERVHRIVVINVHWTMKAFWAAVSPFMHPVTKERMTFCGQDFGEELRGLVGPDHPYLKYAMRVRDLSASEAAKVRLPPRTPFVPGWEKAWRKRDCEREYSSRSTAASSEASMPMSATGEGRGHVSPCDSPGRHQSPCG